MRKNMSALKSTKKVVIKESRLKEIVLEEMVKLMREEKAAEESPKASHEISAAANALRTAIEQFESEGLPEIPIELTTALKVAKTIADNMSDNPGRYRGLNKATNTDSVE